MKKKNILFMMAVFCVMTACEQKEASLPVVSLGEGINDEVIDSDSLSFSVQSVAPLEMTDVSLLGSPRILDDTNNKLLMLDRNKIYSFDNNTGKFLSLINRRGEGEENYMFIADCIPSNNGNIYILDDMRHKIKAYKQDGSFVNSWKNDSIVSFAPIDNDCWIALNSQKDTCQFDICIYDSEWNPIRCERKRNSQLSYNGIIPEYSFMRMNNKTYLEISDTLYSVKGDGSLTTEFWIDEGNLKMPQSQKYDLDKEENRNKYIWRDYLCCSDDFCFVSYMYDEKRYFDVWDINSDKLRFRNVMSKADDPFGLPVKVGDVEVRGWPSFVKDGIFYCVLDEGAAAMVLKSEDECNPCIVRLKVE